MKAGVRHIPCWLLGAGACCALAAGLCLAEDIVEAKAINTSVKSSKDDIAVQVVKPAARSRMPANLTPVPNEPLFEIERIWRESFYDSTVEVTNEAAERGEAKDRKPLDWRFPREEPPPAPPPPRPSAGVGDPEQPRIAADSDDSDAGRTKATSAATPGTKAASERAVAVVPVSSKPVIAAPNPEAGRVFDAIDNVGGKNVSVKSETKGGERAVAPAPDPEIARVGLIDPGDGLEAASIHSKAVPAPSKEPLAVRTVTISNLQNPEAAPRIASGGALDQDDATQVLKQAVAKEGPEDTKPAPAPTNPPSAPISANSSAADSQLKSQAPKPVAIDTRGGVSNSKQKDAKNNKGSASDDSEEKFNALMRENKELMRQRNEKTKAALQHAQDVVTHSPLSDLMLRDQHELKVAAALLDKARHPGSVQATVFDPVTKQPLLARIQFIDATETTARAPLPSGFWSRGVSPAVNVLSGPVLIEVHHGGRFFPLFRTGIEVKAGQLSRVEVPMGRTPELDFEARGWALADLDIGLRKRADEEAVWFGPKPTISDLILAAKCEGVRVIGVTLPLDDDETLASIRYALEHPDPDVLLLPVFPGPRNLFNGSGMGLGVTNWDGLKPDSAIPEIPLREGFEAIRARDGLAVFKDLKGLGTGNIERELFPVYRRLKNSLYFGSKTRGDARLYSCGELPFDALTGAFDVLAFDGTDAAESIWFNLLNEGAPVRAIGAGGGSLQGGRIPFGQTFMQLDGKATREKVLEAITAGRTMVSFGPAVFAKVFERDMGPGAVSPCDGRELSLQIQAYSAVAGSTQIDKVEIIRNGKVVYTQTAALGETEIHDLRYPLKETGNAWYIVRVTERQNSASGVVSQSPRRAWTSPIFFRNAMFAAPATPTTRVHGVLRKGLTPMRGVVSALATGMPTRRIETGADGAFELTVPSTATLIFEAPDCEPLAKRIFEHPRVQRGIGTLTASDDMFPKLADRAAFGLWRLLLSDLDWDVVLTPMELPPEPQKLPEPE